VRRGVIIIGGAALLVACSSSREAGPIQRPTSPTTAVGAADSGPEVPPSTLPGGGTAVPGSSADSVPPSTAPAKTGPRVVTGTAVAGTAGPVETGRPPFRNTDPFAEAVRLKDGTCVGWGTSRGGSTAGLEKGAAVTILDAERNREIGSGSIVRSRWEDVSKGGGQWNCFFDFRATVTRLPAEFRVRVSGLQPWLARPDPSAPDRFIASVNTDASIGLIRSCPALPEPPSKKRNGSGKDRGPARTTTVPVRFASGWDAVGRYWSRGVDSLCKAGLPVTAIARPCRPPRVGSEYIASVVDSNDPTLVYRNGARVREGTDVTVVVATGRLCD
jgi:hypothetical protein